MMTLFLKKLISKSLIFWVAFNLVFSPSIIFAENDIEVHPSNPIQGEPIMIILKGVTATSSIKNAKINSTPLIFSIYNGEATSFYGVDLLAKIGTKNIVVNLKNGSDLKKDFVVYPRERKVATMTIPLKLGGTNAKAAAKLVNNLAKEQNILDKETKIVRSKYFWKSDFVFPVKDPLVTDSYGYSRDTAGYEITHKGIDFRAPIGTEVYSINRGVVRIARYFTVFGNMVVVDHGGGLYSMYLHLSKIYVSPGELVLPGERIAFSGDSGYAEGAHLHLSIRLNGSSVDPEKFYNLFGQKIERAGVN